MIALDTNIAIAYLAGEAQVRDRFRLAVSDGEIMIVSAIVVAEILSYPNIDGMLIARTREWLAGIPIVSFDVRVAEHAAQIRRQTNMKLTDCAIAATALIYGALLATRDQQFRKVVGLTIAEW